MLIGKRARQINIIFAAIEKTSAKYNLKLNYDKCNYVGVNCKAHMIGMVKVTNYMKADESILYLVCATKIILLFPWKTAALWSASIN